MSITAIIDAGGDIVVELGAQQGIAGTPGTSPLSLPASEDLAAGDYVSLWDDAGVARVRKASATATGRRCDGFVLAAVGSGSTATVHRSGFNTAVAGQTVGDIYLQTAAGAGGAAVPNASGNVVQRLGFATSATDVSFAPSEPIELE